MRKVSEILLRMREGLTKYMGVISSDHAYIHQSKAFTLPGITGSIAAGATYKISFKTPTLASGKYIHWRPASIGGTATGVTFELYKDSTSISGGSSALTSIQNMNQANTKASQMQEFYIGRTVTEGTRIQILLGGSAGAGSANEAGAASPQHERVLEQDTVYTGLFTNRSGSTATLIAYEFFWYEEEGYQV